VELTVFATVHYREYHYSHNTVNRDDRYCCDYCWGVITPQVSIASPSIGNTLWRFWTVFTRSAITPPHVNRFGWNLEHC